MRPIIDVAEEEPPRAGLAEPRYVYSGGESAASPETLETIGSRGNRPVKRRRRSPFTIISIIAIGSLLSVFYVWNKITVDRLAVEVNDLQTQYEKILGANEILKAEINKKSSLERIGKAATQAGLIYPKDQPVWFTVSEDKLTRAQELTRH